MRKPPRGNIKCEAGTVDHDALKPFLFRRRWLCPHHALIAIAEAMREHPQGRIEAIPYSLVEAQRKASRRAVAAGNVTRIRKVAS